MLRVFLAGKLLLSRPSTVGRFLALTKEPLRQWEEWAKKAKELKAEIRPAPRALGQKRSREAEQIMFTFLAKMAKLDIRGVLRNAERRLCQ